MPIRPWPGARGRPSARRPLSSRRESQTARSLRITWTAPATFWISWRGQWTLEVGASGEKLGHNRVVGDFEGEAVRVDAFEAVTVREDDLIGVKGASPSGTPGAT